MPIFIADHRLKNFDDWIALFRANPPPPVGQWRLTRSADDPNRVVVIGEVAASDVETVKTFLGSDRMQAVFRQVDAMSTAPIEFLQLEDVKI
jgi:quinol monooxygenase YgiN